MMYPDFSGISKDLINKFATEQNIHLHYNEQSLEFVDNYIDDVRDDLEETEAFLLAEDVGCFLGEMIISNYGGKWKYINKCEQWAITFGGDNNFFPVHHSMKKVLEKADQSILEIYKSI